MTDPFLTDQVLLHWKAGKNTNEIAKLLWVEEASVANLLPRLLERDRQDQEWNFDSLRQEKA